MAPSEVAMRGLQRCDGRIGSCDERTASCDEPIGSCDHIEGVILGSYSNANITRAVSSTCVNRDGENYDSFLACTCPPQFKPVTWPAASRSKVMVT